MTLGDDGGTGGSRLVRRLAAVGVVAVTVGGVASGLPVSTAAPVDDGPGIVRQLPRPGGGGDPVTPDVPASKLESLAGASPAGSVTDEQVVHLLGRGERGDRDKGRRDGNRDRDKDRRDSDNERHDKDRERHDRDQQRHGRDKDRVGPGGADASPAPGGDLSGPASLAVVRASVGADAYWADGLTGEGVDIALIDSGVVPVTGLDGEGKVLNGPDLSFEGDAAQARYLDSYGHGTHLAGIIAGQDPHANGAARRPDRFLGVAPDARLVSIKVADASGASDISQIIAAIDWVVEHRDADGLNIRVLNLSFGTSTKQPYEIDPLAYAVEKAWEAGIFVVVAAGNDGSASGRLANPAYDPYVLAVGAQDTKNTPSRSDDYVPDWSSRGDGKRNPDIVAPGRSIVSLRVPGSFVDSEVPGARVGQRYFRGSGSSQAAAVVSGAAALVIQQRPDITPDQLKGLLTATAQRVSAADPRAQGHGALALEEVFATPTPQTVQTWPRSTGTGHFDSDLTPDGTNGAPSGESGWSGGMWNGSSWTGGSWTGSTWTGSSWTGSSWTGSKWTGSSWTGSSWTGSKWNGSSWTGSSWTGSWLGMTWG